MRFAIANEDLPKKEWPHYVPTRAHPDDAGMDFKSADTAIIKPGDKRLIGTNIVLEIPTGYAGILLPRSSGGKVLMKLANTAGVIDPQYRGDVKVWVHNAGSEDIKINKKDKFAQMLIIPVAYPSMILTPLEQLTATDRGEGGFGSSD